MVEEEMGRFPYRFFVVTFAWSWLIWLPLVLAGAGIIPFGKHLLSAVTVPVDHSGYLRTRSRSVLLSAGIAR